MIRFYFGENGKLVRDKVAELTISQNHGIKTRKIGSEAIAKEILEKLPEEIEELKEARKNSDKEEKKELADVITLLRSYIEKRGFDMSEIEAIISEKNDKKGGFDNGIVVEYVDLNPDGDEYDIWLNHFRSDKDRYIEEKLND